MRLRVTHAGMPTARHSQQPGKQLCSLSCIDNPKDMHNNSKSHILYVVPGYQDDMLRNVCSEEKWPINLPQLALDDSSSRFREPLVTLMMSC